MKKKNRQNDMENTRKHVRGTNSPSYGKDNSVREWEKSRDYENYRFSTKELALYLMQGSFLALGINYLFYKSIWAVVVFLPIPVVYICWQRKRLAKERRKTLNFQFKDALNSMSVAVQAGYSVENAVSACVRDLRQQHVSVPVEELFLDLGQRSNVEDIENFAEVFYVAKRTGGDMNQVIQKVARMLGDKIDVKKEIEATLAAKKSEQLIMSLMPAGIILYLRLTSPGFLDVLYGNPFGICAMTVCLGIYTGAYWMGRRIVDIEV